MSLVFGSLLIATFFLPGILFRSGYFSSREDSFKQRIQLSIIGDLIWISWMSILFNLAGVLIVTSLKYTIDFSFFYKVVNGQELKLNETQFLNSSLPLVTRYIIITSIIAYFIGMAASRLIIRFKLFRTPFLNSILNFKNNWFFHLTGEDLPASPDIVKVDAVIDSGGVSYLYTGYH